MTHTQTSRTSTVSRPLALLAALACATSPLSAQEKPLAQQIADVLVQLNGGIHTGFRFMHAKGLVVTGTFTPAKSARSISTAAHFAGGPVPVTVRFSDGTGNPTIPDTDPNGSPRGMAIRFTLPGGGFTDIVAISHNGFVVGTGEEFLAFLTAVAHTTPQSPHPNPVEQFLGSHPRARKFVQDVQHLSTSFATLAYFGNNAFVFVDSAGKKRAGRYQILPVAKGATLDSVAAAKAGPDYLFKDLRQRLSRGPLRFRLVAQMAAPGDKTNDGSIVWPADRKIVELGSLALTTVAPDNDELQRKLTYNPIFLTRGIELSDDPLIPLRSAVYALSVAHRH
jgi:catalase